MPTRSENIKSQLKKGLLEFFVLQIISEGRVYASDILMKLLAAQMLVVEGTLYPLLSRLKNEGLVGYEWEESQDGPPRKYYTLSSAGQEKLTAFRKAWEEIQASYLTLVRAQ